jgi:hypothetical protein
MIAATYGQKPAEVAEWSPYEMGVALLCLEQADADAYSYTQRATGSAMDKPVMPVFLVGRL